MKFAKHLAKAMRLSDPEWLPFWVNYRFLKKILPSKGSLVSPAAPAAPASPPTVVVASESTPAQNPAEAAPIPASTTKNASSIISRSPSSAGDAPSVVHSAGQGGRWQQVKSKTPVVPAVRNGAAGADEWGRPCQRQPREQYTIRSSSPPSSVASSLVSAGGKTITETCPPLRWQEEANEKLAAERRNDRVVGSSNMGSDDSLGQRKVAPSSGKRKALEATTTSHRTPVFTRPTCCSRPLSGCTKAAITMATAVGLCPPASLASHSAPSAPPSGVTIHPTARCEDGGPWQRQRQGQQEQQPREQQPWQLQQTQFPHHQQLQRRQQYEVEIDRGDTGGGISKWITRTSPPSSSAPVLLCPFYSMLLREIYKCRVFFLQNENDLKARTTRLQFALNQLKNPELSCLSTVKGFHVKLMQACMKFYRDALLLEDFAMVNYTAVIKLLKKRDKLTGASDQKMFMEQVMAAQPFAMYPGVAERVAEVEEIFREIEDMCFLRTGAGMKSVMKTELTVVEAILQLAQESEDTQTRVLHNKDTAGLPVSPGSFRRLSLLKGHTPSHVSDGGNCEDSPKGSETSSTTVMLAACPEKGDGSSRAPGEIPPPSKVGRLATRTPVPTPLRAGGNGNPTGVSEQGRGDTRVPPTSVRVFVSPRDTGPNEERGEEKQNEVVVSVTGVVVSATKTPRLSTNAPRLAVTTAGFGRGIVPKSRLG